MSRFRLHYLAVFSLLAATTVETIHRGSVGSTLHWMVDAPLSAFFTLCLWGLLFSSLSLLPSNHGVWVGWVLTLLVSCLAFLSWTKYHIKGEYLTPSDRTLLREGADMAAAFSFTFPATIVIPTLFHLVIAGSLTTFFLKDGKPLKRAEQLTGGFVGIVLLSSFLFHPPPFDSSQGVNASYRHHGFGLTVSSLLAPAPSTNSNDKTPVVPPIERTPLVRPNVVVILSEAFWDPTVLPRTTFSEDPLPFVRTLMDEGKVTSLVVPVFGGGTANTEFEMLTGMDTRYTPLGSIPYTSLDRPIDSLAHLFRDQGYRATAIHSYVPWFYERDQAYKQLGFDQFLSLEYLRHPVQIGAWMDDEDLLMRSIEEMKNSEGPDFLHLATMLNHGPYPRDRYKGDLAITVSGPYTPENQSQLEVYASTLKRVDETIRLYLEALSSFEEPTVVLLYGDHLPLLGPDYGVYRESGFLSKGASVDGEDMHTTPLLVWSNDPSLLPVFPNKTTPPFVGSTLLRELGFPSRTLFALREQEAGESVYERYQRDALTGSQSSYDPVPSPSPSYVVGEGDLSLEQVEQKGRTLSAMGGPFTPYCTLWVNGKPLPTRYIDEHHLEATLPDGLTSPYTIQVKLMDFTGTHLLQSSPSKKVR